MFLILYPLSLPSIRYLFFPASLPNFLLSENMVIENKIRIYLYRSQSIKFTHTSNSLQCAFHVATHTLQCITLLKRADTLNDRSLLRER